MTPSKSLSPSMPLAVADPAESRSQWDLIEVSPAIDLDDLWSVLKRRWAWLIVIPMLCAAAALAAALTLVTPLYKSTALVYIDPNFDHILQIENVSSGLSDLDSLNSIEKAIVSDSMIIRVIDKLGLRNDLTFLPKSLHKYVEEGRELSGSRLLAEIRKKRVSAGLIRPTRLLELSVYDPDPDRAELITRTFVDEFEAFLGDQKRNEAGNSETELRSQADEAYRRALEAEKRLEDFRTENPDLTVEQDHQLFAERLTKMGEELNAISGRVLDLRSQVETLETVDPDKDPLKVIEVGRFGEIEHVSELLNQRLAAKANLAAAMEQYTDSHPRYREASSRVIEIEAQLRQLAADLKASVGAAHEAAATNEVLLAERVANLQKQLTGVKKASSEFRAIQQKVETEWLVHESLQKQIGETSLVTEKSTKITTLMSEPIASHKPAKPSKPIAVLAGGFAGGLICLGMLAFDLFRGGPFVNRRQLEQGLRVPVSAEIPLSDGSLRDDRLQEVMTGVLLSAQYRQSRFLHVSSVWEDPEGLRVAACLAAASAYYGCPTLLISVSGGGDPRALVNLTPQPSQTENLHTLRLPSSFLIAPNEAWQLLSPHRQHFGRIVIESTSLSQQSQIPAVIASMADANVLLVNQDRGSKREVEETVDRFARNHAPQVSLILVS